MTSTNLRWRFEYSGGLSEAIPNHMMPIQFAEMCRSSECAPEQRLMVAVLADAIQTFCECAGADKASGQSLFCEAAEWFESSDASWPFAFENVCDALGLDSGWIRALLRRWLATHAGLAAGARTIPLIRRNGGRQQRVTAPRVTRKRKEQLAS